MISAMKDGDYETFTFALEKIKNTYRSTVNRDNERYLPIYFINILTRCGKKTISENDDFLLLQVCFTLKDIAFIDAQRKISYTSGEISSLLVNYMEIAFTEKNFSGIAWNIIRIFKNIADEYVKEDLKVSFDVHVSHLGNISTKIAERVSEKELSGYINFIYMLAITAIHGGSNFNPGLEILVSIISDIGIKNAKRELTIPSRAGVPNINFGEWSVSTLKNILKLTNGREGFGKIREFIEECINEHVPQKKN
jgi:hypothetical protein